MCRWWCYYKKVTKVIVQERQEKFGKTNMNKKMKQRSVRLNDGDDVNHIAINDKGKLKRLDYLKRRIRNKKTK